MWFGKVWHLYGPCFYWFRLKMFPFYFEAKQEMYWSLFGCCGLEQILVHVQEHVQYKVSQSKCSFVTFTAHFHSTFFIDHWSVSVTHPTISPSSDPWWTLITCVDFLSQDLNWFQNSTVFLLIEAANLMSTIVVGCSVTKSMWRL